MEGDRRHVVAERHLGGRRIDEVRHRHPGLVDRLVRLGAGRVVPVRIGVMVIEVIRHRLDHPARHLRSTGPVEIRNRLAVVNALERRELGPDQVTREPRLGTRRAFASGVGNRTLDVRRHLAPPTVTPAHSSSTCTVST